MQRKLEIMPLIEQVRDEFKVPIVYISHAIEKWSVSQRQSS